MTRVLVIDGANVVGSRPDGWWRDRPGAAARLHDRLVRAALPYHEVVLVLEGRARSGVPEGATDGVRTVHASGSGDDELVEQCRNRIADVDVTLATADRGLIARFRALGGDRTWDDGSDGPGVESDELGVLGPGTLLRGLPD